MLWLVVLKLVLAVLVIEAVTEILVDSALFAPVRLWIGGTKEDGLDGKFGLKGIFVWCGYCVSVWVGVGMAYFFMVRGIYLLDPALAWIGPYEPVAWGLVAHRFSNLWHEAIVRFLKRVPFTLFIWRRESDK